MSNLVIIPPGERKAVNFVNLIYNGELLGFMAQVSNALLLDDGEVEEDEDEGKDEGPVLMEDGAPTHSAGVSRRWREENGIMKLDWPACSPDLNPIENVWAILKDAIQKRRIRPRTVQDMMVALNEEWQAIRVEFLTRLYSLPQRI